MENNNRILFSINHLRLSIDVSLPSWAFGREAPIDNRILFSINHLRSSIGVYLPSWVLGRAWQEFSENNNRKLISPSELGSQKIIIVYYFPSTSFDHQSMFTFRVGFSENNNRILFSINHLQSSIDVYLPSWVLRK